MLGIIKKLREKLAKTQEAVVGKIDALLTGRKVIDEELLEELEEILITADFGVKTTQDLIKYLREMGKRGEASNATTLKEYIKEKIVETLSFGQDSKKEAKPYVIMTAGVNGVGKTTTIAKLAYKFKKEDKRVMLVAADTFRAAAIEQLEIWSQRVGCPLIKQKPGADPSAVVFDAIKAAEARDIDVLIIDTAGRVHTKIHLMEELKKMKRVIERELSDAPHEIILVLDATTGQNAISQARIFHETLNVTGIALAKLDGTAKGGIIVGIADEMKIPIKYIGLGEDLDDLREFDAREFAEALFSSP